MSKIAFIFPGQGAQYTGMGRDFYEQTETGRKVFDQASELLGFSMPELVFEPNDRLDITEYTQAAMVTTSIAMMKVFTERTGIRPDVAAGLSLGIGGGWRYVGRGRNHHRKAERYPHAAGGSGGHWLHGRCAWHGGICDRGGLSLHG